jgi:2-dehydro-3-deoxygalactonokinase
MASSSIGMIELPYRQLPFAVDGRDAITQYMEAAADFDHPVLLISGIRTNDDVMCGEETQLVGCTTYMQETEGERLFVFPGTHSKHIIVNNKQVTGFKTYMTGEFFELLSQKSILHTGLEAHQDMQYPEYKKAFRQGVNDAVHANLLQATFRARTNSLFNILSKKENYSYLSGLLISTELKDIDSKTFCEVCICGDGKLGAYYELASETLGLDNIRVLPEAWVEQSAVRGQIKIFNQSFIKK